MRNCSDRYDLGSIADEFVEQLAETIDLNSIDYIVANHGEIDHSSALVRLLERIQKNRYIVPQKQ